MLVDPTRRTGELECLFGSTRPFGKFDGLLDPTRPFGKLDGLLDPTRRFGELDSAFGPTCGELDGAFGPTPPFGELDDGCFVVRDPFVRGKQQWQETKTKTGGGRSEQPMVAVCGGSKAAQI
ncbi:hypothetical protein DY000_02058642 [Brassica cretica]|uniref:Uncharacterized protein n=1 Tax=Brassica cretica TaxID=69181 RepID=A0ABQ7AYF1_BRACR|nr:hypothetical protein DY000_02058642 [Brassica cretica]